MNKYITLFTIHVLLLTASPAQQVQWTTTTANGDTTRPVKSTQGILVPFLKFPDGTLQTTVFDSTKLASLYQLSLKVNASTLLTGGYGINPIGDLSTNRMVSADTSNAKATSSRTGYLSYADWNAFNNKQEAYWTRTGGTLSASVTSDSLGLGIEIPNAKVHVVSGLPQLRLSNTEDNSTDKNAGIGSTAYTTANKLATIANMQSTSSNNFLTLGGGTSAMNAATIIGFNTAADNNTATGTERMRITSVGNVGIGRTPSSTARLEIQASNNQLYLQRWFRSGSANEVAAIDTNGRLGVGTTAVVSTQLMVRTNDASLFQQSWVRGDDNTRFDLSSAGSDWRLFSSSPAANTDFVFSVNSSGIVTNDNFGIGVNDPSSTNAKLSVKSFQNQLYVQKWYRSSSSVEIASIDTTGFFFVGGGFRIGLINDFTYAKIDSAKIESDTLKFYVGGISYKAVKGSKFALIESIILVGLLLTAIFKLKSGTHHTHAHTHD